MSLSGISGGGFNPAHMMQQMNDRFHAADVDQSGSLTKAEVSASLEARGVDSSKVDKIFGRMDANNDGQITLQEQQDAMKAMQDRMEKFMGQGGVGQQNGFDAVTSLLESLQADTAEGENQEKLNELLDRLRSGDVSSESLSESVSLLNSIAPPINISV
jgi:Ca2+-binding EF-hand superfamily protein